MGTKSDAKTSGWGITWEQRVRRIITGQILWGNALGDCTREEKQRGVIRGESKGGTHYGETLYGGEYMHFGAVWGESKGGSHYGESNYGGNKCGQCMGCVVMTDILIRNS